MPSQAPVTSKTALALDVAEHWWTLVGTEAREYTIVNYFLPVWSTILYYSLLFFPMIVEHIYYVCDPCHRMPPGPSNSSRFWTENVRALTFPYQLFWDIYRLRPKGSWTKDMLWILGGSNAITFHGSLMWISALHERWIGHTFMLFMLDKHPLNANRNKQHDPLKFQTPQTALSSSIYLLEMLEICSSGRCPCRVFFAAPQDAPGVQLQNSMTQKHQTCHKRRATAGNPRIPSETHTKLKSSCRILWTPLNHFEALEMHVASNHIAWQLYWLLATARWMMHSDAMCKSLY